jgi:hypothetical protein
MGHVDLQAFELDPRVSASEQAILSIFYQRRAHIPCGIKICVFFIRPHRISLRFARKYQIKGLGGGSWDG